MDKKQKKNIAGQILSKLQSWTSRYQHRDTEDRTVSRTLLPDDLTVCRRLLSDDQTASRALSAERTVNRQLLAADRTENRRLLVSLWRSTQMMDHFANELPGHRYPQWDANFMSYIFSNGRVRCCEHGEGGCCTVLNTIKAWLRAHEEAQVMLASVLVVVGLWWLVRTVLSLLINLVCPLLVVLLAVVLVPQLRAPLLGQNYPALANVLSNILSTMAENIKRT